MSEVDGSTAWSSLNVLVYTGDTVHWSWTNYHNVVEINDAGIIVSGGIRSGDPVLASSYAYTFSRAGVYLFKSQAADTMRMTVEVREFAVRNGTMFVGGDLEVGGEGSAVSNGMLRVGGSLEVSGMQVSGPGFAQEVRLFLGDGCARSAGGRAAVCGAPAGRVPVLGRFHHRRTPCLCAGFGGPASRYCGAVRGCD